MGKSTELDVTGEVPNEGGKNGGTKQNSARSVLLGTAQPNQAQSHTHPDDNTTWKNEFKSQDNQATTHGQSWVWPSRVVDSRLKSTTIFRRFGSPEIAAALCTLKLWARGPSLAGPPPAVLCDLAPTGTLRAANNFGNPMLAQRDPVTGSARGVTPALARELASRLGVPLTLVPFESAGKVRRPVHSGCACMHGALGKGSHGDVVASKSVVTPCAGGGWVFGAYHEGCTERL